MQSITCLLSFPSGRISTVLGQMLHEPVRKRKSMLQKGGAQCLKLCLSSSPAGMVSYQQPLNPITFTPRTCLTKSYSQSIIEHGSDNKIGWLKDSLVALPTSLRPHLSFRCLHTINFLSSPLYLYHNMTSLPPSSHPPMFSLTSIFL